MLGPKRNVFCDIVYIYQQRLTRNPNSEVILVLSDYCFIDDKALWFLFLEINSQSSFAFSILFVISSSSGMLTFRHCCFYRFLTCFC
ncbi:hypothetical protein Hdeb2414_s0019g00540391 [Helianthus debilis subsp. tardiflorus]